MSTPTYLHLTPGQPLPGLEVERPFKAVLVIENDVTPEWQGLVSDWLVRGGCLYMMAWGQRCSDWDDSVDEANLELFDYQEIPEGSDVMTTWHAHDTLQETFWFCEHWALHPTIKLDRTLILHVSSMARREELLQAFRDAQAK